MQEISFCPALLSGKHVSVTGYLVTFPDVPGFEFVVHRCVTRDGKESSKKWSLSERSTGYTATPRPLSTMNKAIDEAHAALAKLGVEKIRQGIESVKGQKRPNDSTRKRMK